MPHLILVRHGKSEWNERGLWTGQTDVDLIAEGIEEARRAGQALRDVTIHQAYVSELKRAQQTLQEILGALEIPQTPTQKHAALNERHYGDYTGKNKWEIKELVGDEVFQRIRRSWDEPIPGGESLKDVHARVVPYYENIIRADIGSGRNVIVVAHGNSLRALAKHIEGISDEAVAQLEIGTGEIHCYELTTSGEFVKKEIRAVNEKKKAV